jgi:hypothetical protein
MLVKEFLLKKNPWQLNPRKTCTGWKKKKNSSGRRGSQKVTCTGWHPKK